MLLLLVLDCMAVAAAVLLLLVLRHMAVAAAVALLLVLHSMAVAAAVLAPHTENAAAAVPLLALDWLAAVLPSTLQRPMVAAVLLVALLRTAVEPVAALGVLHGTGVVAVVLPRSTAVLAVVVPRCTEVAAVVGAQNTAAAAVVRPQLAAVL